MTVVVTSTHGEQFVREVSDLRSFVDGLNTACYILGAVGLNVREATSEEAIEAGEQVRKEFDHQ